MLPDGVVGRIPEEMGGGDPLALPGHEGQPFAHPLVDDELSGLALQLAQDRVDGG